MREQLGRLAGTIFLIPGLCFAGYHQKFAIAPNGAVYFNLITKEQRKNILKFCPAKNNLTNYYRVLNYEKCNIDDTSMDATGDKIAIMGGCSIPGVKDPDKQASWFYTLTIVETNSKKEIISLSNGRESSFSPNGRAIVYAEKYPGETGSPIPPGYKGGLWLYDFDTKVKKQINTLGVIPSGDYRAQDVNWSEHDGNIYYTNYDKVFLYNPKTEKGKISTHKGIYFSPDGKYYVLATWEGGGGIYRTSDDKDMAEWNNLILAKSPSQYQDMGFMFWSKKLNAVVFSVVIPSDAKSNINTQTNVIFDINKGKVIGDFREGIIGINADGTLVATPKAAKSGQTTVGIINLLQIIKK